MLFRAIATRQHFPYFLHRGTFSLSAVKVYLAPKGSAAVDTSGLNLTVSLVNAAGQTVNVVTGSWGDFSDPESGTSDTRLKVAAIGLVGDPITKWKITGEGGGLDQESLDDVLILIKYTVTPPS